jgi:hypothetical protein
VSTSTAPDFYPVLKDLPRVRVAAGVVLQLLVVAADGFHCAGVDVDSGALVRAWSPVPEGHRLNPYDVVEVTLDENADVVPDPSEPEALAIIAAPEPVGRITGRKAERLIRPLLHPKGQALLGVGATAVPFYERRSDHPSIGLVDPEGPTLLRRDGSFLSCRFGWQGHQRELPCLDRRRAAEMDRAGMTRMAATKGARLVVAFTPPINGRCHKVVEAVLPRP